MLWVAEYCGRAIRDSGDHLSGTWLCLPGWHQRGSPWGVAESASSGSSPETLWPLSTRSSWHMQVFFIIRIPEKFPHVYLNLNAVVSIPHCVTLWTSVADSLAVQSGWTVWVSVTIPLISRQHSQESLFSPVYCQSLSLLAALISLTPSSAYQTPVMSTSPYLCLVWDIGHGDI